MTRKDLKEIGMWAAATAVVAVGLAACRTAVSDDVEKKPTGPSAVVRGLHVSAAATADAKTQTLNLDVTVANPTDKALTLGGRISVVRQEFYGNPMSRAVTPSDIKSVPIASHHIDGTFAAGTSRTIRLSDSIASKAPERASFAPVVRTVGFGGPPPPRPAPAKRRDPRITYVVFVVDGNKAPQMVASYRPVQSMLQ